MVITPCSLSVHELWNTRGAPGSSFDISLELDPKNFGMRTPAGFTKDMQFEMEVIKEHDSPGGAGQIVRGMHMRLHAGSHVGRLASRAL